MTRIAIVGGGPGGLFTAQLLEEFCADLCEVTLFEASPRLGGKVVTETFASAPATYEVGVAEIYDYSHFGPDPINQLIKKLGLSTVPMTGPTVILGDAILRNDADIRKHFGTATLKALRAFQRKCRDLCTPADYYEGHSQDDNTHAWSDKTFREVLDEIPDEIARKYIEVAVRSDVATEPHLTSALNGLKNVLMDDPRYLRLYSIEGGIQRLTDALAARLKSKVILEAPVVRVGKNPDGTYRVTARQQGAFIDHDFDLVIMALPNYWLQRVEWASPELRQAMQKHLAHYDKPAHYLRVTALFKKPFWRKDVPGSYFMSDAFGGCCVYDEGARHPCDPHGVLGWLLAGNDAMALSNHDDARLIDLVLDSLPKPLAHGRELFLEARVQRWVGTISGQPGGQPTHEIHQRHMPDAKDHPGLFLVGDYLFDSTINGVYDSADFTTDLILVEMRKKKYIHQFNDYPVNASGVAPSPGVNGKHLPANPDQVDRRYHDFYYGDVSYEEAFKDDLCFNADWTLQIIEAVWGKKPPYRMLDSGSACGLTLEVLAKHKVEAWGIENSKYIHSQTPAKWKKRNLLGDVRKLPFPDNHFEFVYDTCLPHLPPEDLDQAIRELFRVARTGVFFSGVTADMTREVIEDYNLFQGVRSLYTLWEWSEIFLRNGFRMAVADQKKLAKIWQIESEIEEDDWYWYSDPESMRYCFYSKPAAETSKPVSTVLNGHLGKDYFDYYDGNRTYAESWKDCFCEQYTTDLIGAIWGRSPPYSLLDAGSASGLTLQAFARLGVDAWGIENNEYIHKQTPSALRHRNLLGDVRHLPFPDNSFDFIYETCLCHVPKKDLDHALRELFRVCRVGVFFSSIASDMTAERVEALEMDEGLHSLFSLAEWSERFLRRGFQPATRNPRRLAQAWKIELDANPELGPTPWYANAQAMANCFYSKPQSASSSPKRRRVRAKLK